MWLFWAVLINVCYVSCNVIATPKNSAAIAGQGLVLECRTENGSTVREWTFESSSKNFSSERKMEKVFSNWSYRSVKVNFAANVDQYGSGSLNLNEARLEDAGVYTCAVEVGRDMVLHSAQLIVLESRPVCHVIVSEEYHIRMQCSVNFSGNWPPKMEWSRQVKDVALKVGQRITSGIDHFSSTDHVSSTLNAILYSTEEFFFSCKIYFAEHSGLAAISAKNTPDYVYLWNSSIIRSQSNFESDTTSDKTGVSVFDVSNTGSTGQSTNSGDTNTLFLVGFLLVLLILIIVVATSYYIHKKCTLSADKRGKPVSVEIVAEMPIFDGYDILPYACSGDSDFGVEELNSGSQTGQLWQHHCSLPTQDQSVASVVLSSALDQSDGYYATDGSAAESSTVHNATEYTYIEPKGMMETIERTSSVIEVEVASKINKAILPPTVTDVESRTDEEASSLEEIPSVYLMIIDEDIELVKSKLPPLSTETSGKIDNMISTKRASSDAHSSTYTKLLVTE